MAKKRSSNIELLRIIAMVLIVAHHYIVNSGILDVITQQNVLQFNSIFALIFGWAGKTGINCFVMITGYFMCKSNITLKKFLKLLLEIEFYNIVIWTIFLLTGYSQFSVKSLIKAVLPIYYLGTEFIPSYLVFFLFIPFLNILIKTMTEKQHLTLVGLCLLVDTILQTFFNAPSAFTYVGWFMVLYFTASYISLYAEAKELKKILLKIKIKSKEKIFEGTRKWGFLSVGFVVLSWLSVLAGAFIYHLVGKNVCYYFVADSNKILAVTTAICVFLFFRNLNIKFNPIINTIAASTFGVLLIHANSDTMRQWLWKDLLNNVGAFQSSMFVVHAVVSVLGVYIVCTLIDMLRIKFIEKPLFKHIGRKKA